MADGEEKKFVCKVCYKEFPSGKSLGGHIKIHSDHYKGNKKKRLVGQREKQQQQQVCSHSEEDEMSLDSESDSESEVSSAPTRKRSTRVIDQKHKQQHSCKECRNKFVSLKALRAHMACHRKGEEMLMDSESDTESETSSSPTRKRSKRVMAEEHKQQRFCQVRGCGKGFVSFKAFNAHMACHSEKDTKMLMDSHEFETSSDSKRERSKKVTIRSDSEYFSSGSLSFGSETDQDAGRAACILLMVNSGDSYENIYNWEMNSRDKSSEKNSRIVKTKSSSGKKLKIFNVKSQVLETGKVADGDQLRSADDNGVIDLCDSDGSEFMNSSKKSDSDISVDGSPKNTGFGAGFNNSNRLRNSDKGGSKYDLRTSKRGLFSYETDSSADTNRKIHRFRDSKDPVVKKAGGGKKNRKIHKCLICFKVFKSGQEIAYGTGNQEHNQVTEVRYQFDLNLPAAADTDDEE
ncbi:hypothetical protein CARUB_v10011909mg [Capsella rubella]|uniref:C2H2-type domain-containing protein n=1 Tax=Capsella rubella TaxID=81985 RepID=R0GLJ7_9BRAS|nr:hypothetical protein CARUB_v10011909mg [Capsella rubella]